MILTSKSNYDLGPNAPILVLRLVILAGLETLTSTKYQTAHRRLKNTKWKSHTKKCHYMSDLIRLYNLGHCELYGGGDNVRHPGPVVVIRSD